MKSIILLGLACLIRFVVFSQGDDFRSVPWGSSFSTIKLMEKAHFVMKIKDDELIYHDQLAGDDCEVLYIFNGNGKLQCGLYHFTKKYANPQLYVDNYYKFKSLLVQKYGMFVCESENWANNTGATDKENYGQAVAGGNLSLNSIWHTGRSTIKIQLMAGSDKQPVLQIHYSAQSPDVLENPEELKAAMGKL